MDLPLTVLFRSDHVSQLVDFAVREARLPFLRVLDVREQEVELCMKKRDIAFYTKHQIPPIKSVLDGVLEIVAVVRIVSYAHVCVCMCVRAN